ncbi:MAG: hypothetical protein CML43_07560 [Rhodobacteraceae bacterium]|nr:hypothetical protein [Paracoccaceae bacterium]
MAEPPPEKMSKAPPGTSANAGGRGRHHMEPLTRGYEDSSGKLPPDAPDAGGIPAPAREEVLPNDAAARRGRGAEDDLFPDAPFEAAEEEDLFASDPAPPDIGPLAGAAGKALELDGLLAGAGGMKLSDTLAETLRRALDYPAAPDVPGPEGAPVRLITPLAYLAAALEEADTKEERDWATAQEAAFDWAVSRPEGFSDDPAIRPDDARPAPVPGDAARAALAPDLTDLVIEAARIVRRTHANQRRIDARHLLAALAGAPAGAQALADMGLLRPDPAQALAEFRDALAAHALAQRTRFERERAWREVFDAIDPAALAAGLRPAAPAPAPLPDFRSDDVTRAREGGGWLAADRLGAAADARAFADLICLEEARPPLAIGLFGAWGSGKSTFMRMIEEGVEDNRATAIRLAEAGEPSPFVRNVVHVWFNAWHYLDANLWASLVSHIFRELDRQSREAPRDFLEEAQLGALVRKLATAEKMEAEATETAAARRKDVETARRKLQALEARRAEQFLRLARAAPDMLDPEARARLDAALRDIGVVSAGGSLADLGDLAAEGRRLGGRLGLVLGSLTSGRRAVWSPLPGLALLAVGGVGGLWLAEAGLPARLAEFGSAAAAGLGALAGAAAWLAPHLARVNAALKPVFEAEAKAQAEREGARAELERLEAEQAAQERDLAQAREDLAGLRALARGERPAELLAHFIEDRAGGEGYRRHLGLLSRIRDDFELMSRLMRERAAGAGQGDADGLPGIERIVLYIDDLDRCRDKQVVEVLEAIHLLLAFDLFVVVVGVDSRWIEGALGRFYRRQLTRDGAEGPADAGDRPSVADYLEKIFQAPFRLRPLDFGEGGGYARLVDDLLGEPASEEGDGAQAGDPPVQGGDAPSAPAASPASGGLTVHDLAPPPPPETATALYARLRLTRAERDAICALGPVIGASPRKVKRFVNLYRLMRARRRGAELEAFLGNGEGPAPFRMALLWLAIETGLGPEAVRRFAEAMRAQGRWDPFILIHAPPMEIDDDWEPKFWDYDVPGMMSLKDSIVSFWSCVPERSVRESIRQVLRQLNGIEPELAIAVVSEAERFSLRGGENLFEGLDRGASDPGG